MVHIRYISLIASLSLIVAGGCSTPGTTTGASVEDRSRPLEDESPVDTVEKQSPESTADDAARSSTEWKELPPPDSSDVERSTEEEQAPASRRPQSGPAVVALLGDAENYSGKGNNQQAIASLERALRIEPKNPVLWHKLSQMHLYQGDHVQAIAMAKKSNVLASGDSELQGSNWQIIARARQGLGDNAGAEEARRNAEKLLH